jgi:hypothetical protein
MKLLFAAAAAAASLLLLAGAQPSHAANDTIAKVRATIAAHDAAEVTHEAAQDALDVAQNARLKALEDKVAAIIAATPSTTPAPTPAPGNVYPAGVVKAGLQSVFDARPGTIRPLTKKLGPGVPAGAYEIVAGTVGYTGGGSTSDADATGLDYYFNGGTFAWDNIKFNNPAGGWYVWAIGHENGVGGAATFKLSHALVDQNSAFDKGALVLSAGSRLEASGVSFLGASGTNLNALGDSSLTDVYFDAPGQKAGPLSHTENIHFGNGTHTVTRAFFDARAWAGHQSHATGLVYVEGGWVGSVTVTLKDTILAGAGGIGSLSPFQIFAKPPYTATLIMENVVIQRGPGNGTTNPADGPAAMGYIYWGTGITIKCHNCFDYDTGANIDAIMNLSVPQTASNDNDAPLISRRRAA